MTLQKYSVCILVASVLLFGLLLAGCGSKVISVQKATAKKDQTHLIEVLTNAEEDWLIEDAAWGLARVGTAKAVAPLLAILNNTSGSADRRAAAAYALGHIKDPRAVQPLVGALERAGNPEERYWIVVALGAFDDSDAKAALESVCGDADVMVSRAARKGLLRFARGER